MLPVEIHPIQDALVLRARGSELLILANHVAELKKLKSAGDFSKYFLHEALVNRPARKLFEAWLRKDGSLWARIYKTVQTIETSNAQPAAAPSKKEASSVKPTHEAEQPKAEQPKAVPPKSDKKSGGKSETPSKVAAKQETKPLAAKSAKKDSASPTKADSKKEAPKAKAKPAVKTPSKAAAKTATKPSAKKPSK